MQVRLEHDLLGSKTVPQSAYYGVQTLRAYENFQISGSAINKFPALIKALAMVKKAAAETNCQLGDLAPDIAYAICCACDDIIAGKLHEHFVVDLIQGGAGTSTNMNANEVIANRALEHLGHGRGDYQRIHPINHVNLAQSTNDVYPTAGKLAILIGTNDLLAAMQGLVDALAQKGVEFAPILKIGRTQLQDAVPMTLGQEFAAFAATLAEDIGRIRDTAGVFLEINLGGTAIGTGINTDPAYSGIVIERLATIAGFPFCPAPDLIEATSDTGSFVVFAAALKRVAIKLSKICNDLRLLSSGPRAGLGEINLPPVQPGSSIMPGKVNPVIPEAVNMVAFQVMGHEMTITLAAQAGQLQLNAFEPVMVSNILESMSQLTSAMNLLATRCVMGITANEERCRMFAEESIGLVTAVQPHIGYENSTRIALQALKTGAKVKDLILAEGLLQANTLNEILKPENMTKPRRVPRS